MGNMSEKFLKWLRLEPDMEEDEDDGYYDEEDEVIPKKEKKHKIEKEIDDTKVFSGKSKSSIKQSGKVIPMRSSKSNMEVCVIKPSSMDDTQEITDTLLSGRAVVLNMEGLNLDIAQRIIDFTSGSSYAMRGKIQKISTSIFIVTPETVEISGDVQDSLAGSIDVSNFQGLF